jgi:serum/glucocorticoid-regulated kinase 2
MEDTHNPLDDYFLLSVIGKGSYAKVVLARKKTNGSLYALKSMKKKYI